MTATVTTTATNRRGTASIVGAGLAATAVAALATSTVAAVGSAASISLDVSGAPIPVSGFAVLTVVFSLVGVVLAAVLARRARRPRSTFVRTTVVLTALSLVPDVVADATTDTRVLLMVTHLVAAAIVVPAVARRLPAGRRH
jgi:peptidoglycan/LPS O-acetylase OafA/YrhL